MNEPVTRERPVWWDVITVLVNVGIFLGFVAWLGVWGVLPAMAGVFVASFGAAVIERRRWLA